MPRPSVSTVEFNTLLATLLRLSPTQLAAINVRVKSLLPREKAREVELADDWLLNGLVEAAIENGVWTADTPLVTLSKSTAWRNYIKTAPGVKRALIKSLNGTKEKHHLRFFGLLCGRALAHDLRAWSMVSMKTLLNNVSSVPGALDKAYPGYLRAGMFGYLLEATARQEESRCLVKTA